MIENLAAAANIAAERLTRKAADKLAAELMAERPLATLRQLVLSSSFTAVVGELEMLVSDVPPPLLGAAIAAAVEAVDSSRTRTTEIVWTGPKTDHVQGRQTAQALRQVIDHAKDRLILASFAVYRVDVVSEALVRAGSRGVHIDLIAESSTESDGAITFDGVGQLGKSALATCRLLTWPGGRRPTENNKRAALHAKFAVADRAVLLVTSANLTGHGLGLNMELGLLVTGGEAPKRVVQLVDDLIAQGDLVAMGL